MENNTMEQKVSALEQRIEKLEKAFSMDTIGGVFYPEGVKKKLSIKEFLITKKLDDDVKRTLAVSYFIEHMENIKPFNTEDLKKAFRLAKIPLPSNVNDKINMNIRTGRIMEAEEKKDSKKAWELTATGEIFVENELNK